MAQAKKDQHRIFSGRFRSKAEGRDSTLGQRVAAPGVLSKCPLPSSAAELGFGHLQRGSCLL